MADLINITAPQYRCGPIASSCPAVYKSEDGKTFTIIGAIVGASQIGETKVGFSEEAVEISADLLLSSLGIPALIEAANSFIGEIEDTPLLECRRIEGLTSFRVLRNIVDRISSIKGGK